VTFVAPETLVPFGARTWGANIEHDLDQVLQREQPEVVMMLRVQLERMQASYFPSAEEYARIWGLNSERFRRLGPETLVMHPGPMNRGVEISSEAADSAQATILDQVANGVSVRMAVLYMLLAGERVTQA
jgi:aspartate carbamoyltransferase catalytic subunit